MARDSFYIAETDAPAKREILHAALRLFARDGLSATSIRDIGKAAGYTNPALYKHFKTKDALAQLLFERAYAELHRRLARGVSEGADFDARFRGFLGAYTAFYDAHPDALIFLTDNLPVFWPRVSDSMKSRTIITLLRELLSEGQGAGLVGNAGTGLQITLVVGTLGQMARQVYLGALPGPASRHVDGIERMLRKGLS